jgi:DNA-binding CsgD family transcriptional regulator
VEPEVELWREDIERRLLLLLAEGRSGAEAAEALALDLATTARLLSAMRERLGVRSTAAAIDVLLGRSSR